MKYVYARVVGIGGGLLVTIITRYLFSKRDNSEYMQKVSTVNREIIYESHRNVKICYYRNKFYPQF